MNEFLSIVWSLCPKAFRKHSKPEVGLNAYRENTLSEHFQYFRISRKPVKDWNALFHQVFPRTPVKNFSITWMDHKKFKEFYPKYFKAVKKNSGLHNDLWTLFKFLDCFPTSIGVQALWDKKQDAHGPNHNGYVLRIVKKESNFCKQ